MSLLAARKPLGIGDMSLQMVILSVDVVKVRKLTEIDEPHYEQAAVLVLHGSGGFEGSFSQ